jgi:cell division protein FtsB
MIHVLWRLKHYVSLQNVTVAVALVVAMGWMWGTVSVLQKNYLLQRSIDDYDQQVQLAQLETDTMAYQQQYYRSQEFLDMSARDKLDKASPGEHLVRLPISDVPPEQRQAITGSVIRDAGRPSNFQQWMRFFFGTRS